MHETAVHGKALGVRHQESMCLGIGGGTDVVPEDVAGPWGQSKPCWGCVSGAEIGLELSYFIATGMFPFCRGISGLSFLEAMPCSSGVCTGESLPLGEDNCAKMDQKYSQQVDGGK